MSAGNPNRASRNKGKSPINYDEDASGLDAQIEDAFAKAFESSACLV